MNYRLVSMLLAGAMGTVIASLPAQAGFQWTAPSGVAASASGAAMPRVPAAPVAPVISEGLPTSLDDMTAGTIPTTPDGPASQAPVYYGQGPNGPMTDDPITWNQPASATAPRAPQSVLPAETQPLYPTGTAVQTTYTAPAPMPAAPVMATPAIVATPIAAPQAAMIQSAATVTSAPASVMAPVGYGVYETAEGFGSDLPLVMAIRQIVPASYGFVFDESINLSTNVSWQGGRPWNLVLTDTLAPLGLRAAINGNVVSIVPAGSSGMMQQISMTGPMVTSDVVTATTTTTTTAPAILPQVTYAAPAVYQGPVFQATPAAAGTADLGATTTWTAPRNSTLRSILEDWSERVGVELYWAAEYDYPVQSAVSINGSFEEAVQTLLKGLGESKPRPMGRLHPNLPNGPAVLVIETRQNAM